MTEKPSNPVGDSIAAKLLVLADEARNLAKVSKLHFDALKAEGFTSAEAVQIVIGLLTAPKAK